MNTINFCKKKCYKIENPLVKNKLEQILIKMNYPKCIHQNIDTFSNKYSEQIENIHHLITAEMYGTPFLLLLAKINNKQYCIFIDLESDNKDYIYVRFRFAEELFNGTLFVGELTTDNNNNWIYYVKNILFDSGKSMENILLSQRISRIYEIFRNNETYKYDDFMNVCQLLVRPYFLYHQLNLIIDDSVGQAKKIRYFYLVPDSAEFPTLQVLNDKQNIISKNKTQEELIKLLTAVKTEQTDTYIIYDKDIELGKALIRTSNCSKMMNKLLLGKNQIEIKCKYSTHFNKWEPIVN